MGLMRVGQIAVLAAEPVSAATRLASQHTLTAAGMRVTRCFSHLFAVAEYRPEGTLPRGISKFTCLWHAVAIGTANLLSTMCHSISVLGRTAGLERTISLGTSDPLGLCSTLLYHWRCLPVTITCHSLGVDRH
jgi:hypothetical protein